MIVVVVVVVIVVARVVVVVVTGVAVVVVIAAASAVAHAVVVGVVVVVVVLGGHGNNAGRNQEGSHENRFSKPAHFLLDAVFWRSEIFCGTHSIPGEYPARKPFISRSLLLEHLWRVGIWSFVEARRRFLRLSTICLWQGGCVRRMVFLWRVCGLLVTGVVFGQIGLAQQTATPQTAPKQTAPKPKSKSTLKPGM